MNEKVLVVPASKVDEITKGLEGVIEVEYSLVKNLITRFGTFIDRDLVENDESFRQVIPYVIMKQDGKFLVLRRTNKQGEKRLHNKISLGVGGHINHNDGKDPWLAFLNGMQREIEEEVKAKILDLKYFGVINDLSSSVSRVHVGIAFIADVLFEKLNEPEMFEYSWCALEDLEKLLQEMEGWSYIVFQWLRKHTQR
ncbi:NUDIX domain-containing protein [Pseudothermotoga thermarum]|uniref:NUDIX hydrolase n=1 Tax=Pseudothermotoga thermarum DSM 5069 TaxID=688269 RepID=F7YW41_9THEM|nr:NUDIX domain-containing protein [Pseudothermotoga thermarum]AEH50530.1 NUDIX hydrolase [Pseudothermotoga thermarum DSM 5069]